MCNLYSIIKNQDAIRRLFGVARDLSHNLPPLLGVFPDYMVPIIRNGSESRKIPLAR